MKRLLFLGIIIVAIVSLIILFYSRGGENSVQDNEPHMKIESSAFQNGETIPAKYTCDGEDINPPLAISGVPNEAKSLVLVMDDPDAPVGTWDHWVVYNISPETSVIGEDSVPEGSLEGQNSFGRGNWGGPCPHSGEHRYFFKLYALDLELDLDPSSATKKDIETVMEGHILAQAELIGRYERPS